MQIDTQQFQYVAQVLISYGCLRQIGGVDIYSIYFFDSTVPNMLKAVPTSNP